jgi:hypothetical protein
VATEHNLYKKIGDIDLCVEFEMLKVKVPIIFLGTVGFSPPRDGIRRQLCTSVTLMRFTRSSLPTA